MTAKRYLVSVATVMVGYVAAAATAQEVVAGTEPASELFLRMGLTDEALPTAEWIDMIRVFNDDDTLESIAQSRTPLTAAQLAWRALIEARARSWPAMIEDLQIPFGPVTPPPVVAIVLGNIGGSDAFVREEQTIGFDLDRLGEVYGSAGDALNTARIDRFFAHEYTHLLHKAWRNERGLELRTPLEVALWDCLTEGLGNYRSLSDRWTTPEGRLSEHADAVLARLQPIFVARLAALEYATEDAATALMEGLSMGPFDQKWGALTVALWLTAEAAGDHHALRKWVELGPWGVLELAQRHLAPDLSRQLPVSRR